MLFMALLLDQFEPKVNLDLAIYIIRKEKKTFMKKELVGLLICYFTSQQLLRSYQDGYLLVTMLTRGDFSVLPHWETRLPAP